MEIFNILNRAAIYIDHYLAGVSNKQCLFTFFIVIDYCFCNYGLMMLKNNSINTKQNNFMNRKQIV